MKVELITKKEIIEAVNSGKKVYCGGGGYEVIKDSKGQYLIICMSNNHCVGLSGTDGTQYENVLNHSDFYVEEETQEFTIVITETLKREVKVIATNEAEALEIVNKQDIVLDADDFTDSFICPAQDLEISVLFGEDEKGKFFIDGEIDDSIIGNIKKNTFTTLAEKSAYIEGLNDNDGWGDYGILGEQDLVKIANFQNK